MRLTPEELAPFLLAGAILLAAVSLASAIAAVVRMQRRRKRRCPQCSEPGEGLGARATSERLSRGQQLEMELGSVDYQLYGCSRCNVSWMVTEVQWLEQSRRCRACGFRTVVTSGSTLDQI